MAGKYGTKETKELLTLVKTIGLAIVKEAKKDGWQPKDVLAFLKSDLVEAAIAPALQDIVTIPLEVTELDVFDGLDLGRHAYGCMDEIVDALKMVVAAKPK
jgi:hypothetical protein